MSSSKIQARNIDASADIAKESSVQEVLSAVGSGSSFYEIMKNLQSKQHIDANKIKVSTVSSGTISSATTKTFSFSGKMRIYSVGAYFSGSYSTSIFPSVTLTIDGTTYDYTSSSTYTSSISSTSSSLSTMMFSGVDSLVYNKPVLSFRGNDYYNNNNLNIYPIECNESFSISAKISSSGSQVVMGIIYEEIE